jgi:urease accessory protein
MPAEPPIPFRRAVVAFAMLCEPASAHQGGVAVGYLSGFLHPLTGPDHIIAMVAVGLWASISRSPGDLDAAGDVSARDGFRGRLGVLGIPLPAVETGIALSAIVLGLMVTLAARPPLRPAAILVGVFAICHGHAHGVELPKAANAVAYAIGFVTATGLLHLTGIAFGLLARWPAGEVAVRTAGVVIASGGIAYLTGLA